MRKKKVALAILFLLIVIVYAAYCEMANWPHIDNDNYNIKGYNVIIIDNGHIYFGPSGVEITEADRDTLIGLGRKELSYEDMQAPKLPLDDISAAEFGIQLLDKNYENWAEDKHAVVVYNKNANAWIICGQKKDRYSVNPSGLCVISKDGDILALTREGESPD